MLKKLSFPLGAFGAVVILNIIVGLIGGTKPPQADLFIQILDWTRDFGCALVALAVARLYWQGFWYRTMGAGIVLIVTEFVLLYEHFLSIEVGVPLSYWMAVLPPYFLAGMAGQFMCAVLEMPAPVPQESLDT